MRVQRSRSRQRGAAALEFALVVPVIILMVLGIVDLGMLMNAQAVVANAARDGARVASLGKTAATARTAAQTTVQSMGHPPTSVTVVCMTSTNCPSGGDYDTLRGNRKTPGEVVQVTVTYTYTFITPLPAWIGIGPTTTIRKASYMRIEGVS